MGNKQTNPHERGNDENDGDCDENGRRVRFQVYQERESGLFRSFRTRPFKRANPEKRRSTTYLGTASKTAWPHPQSDSLFLPEYEYKSAVQFNDFQILENIGKGTFGHILKVKKKENQQIFAMKVSNKSDIVREDFIKQCKDEIMIQNKLNNHPFVTNLKCSWQTKHNLYVVTEFVDFGDLHTFWMAKKKFDEKTVKLLGAEIALALDFFHQNGIIYRDLKMENILITRQGHIVITDFGLSKWLAVGQKTCTVTGTLKYMAPEMLRSERYGHEIDWYALGAVLCATLLAKFPYPVPVEQKEKQELLKDVSQDAGNILQKLLEKDPKQRLCSLEAYKTHPFNSSLSFQEIGEKKHPPFTGQLLHELIRTNITKTETQVKLQLREKSRLQKQQHRPNSWASPENFRIQFDQAVKQGKGKEIHGMAHNTKF